MNIVDKINEEVARTGDNKQFIRDCIKSYLQEKLEVNVKAILRANDIRVAHFTFYLSLTTVFLYNLKRIPDKLKTKEECELAEECFNEYFKHHIPHKYTQEEIFNMVFADIYQNTRDELMFLDYENVNEFIFNYWHDRLLRKDMWEKVSPLFNEYHGRLSELGKGRD